MTRYLPLIIIALVLITFGLLLLGQCSAPPPVVVTPTIVTATATSTPKPSISPTATFLPPTATVTPEKPTETPTARISPTVAPTATPATPIPTIALLGTHIVRRGETMYTIALAWEPRRFFLWGDDVWRPVCRVNPQIVDCRVLYPGDVLRIPRR